MQGKIQFPVATRKGLAMLQNKALPAPADPIVLRQVADEVQAFAVSMVGMKLAYITASLGKSEGYISRIRNGKRPIPAWMVEPFCRITGTLLLKQVIRRQQVEAEAADELTREQVNARIAAQLRNAA